MMCATRIDQKPSVPASPALVNSASSEEPITTSGVAIGRKISRLVVARPRKRCRTSANATSVPSTRRAERGEQADLHARDDRVAHAGGAAGVQPVVRG